MKPKKKSPELSIRPLIAFFARFRTLIFFLIISIGLFAAIMVLISIISLSASTATSSDNAINGSFDQATIDQIEQQSSSTISPGSRPSPFTE